jgi:tetratricopeptide (TPR) repeat protein
VAQSERLALVIGVDGYKSPLLAPLPSCRKDAFDIAKELSTSGYSIFDNGPMIGSNIQDPNAWSKIRQSIINLFYEAKPSQKLIFYFSGHGIPHGSDIYLATPEVDPNNPRFAGFALSDLASLIGECKSKQIVCIIDACYSGAINLPESQYTKKAAKNQAALALTTYDKIWKNTPKSKGVYFMLSSQAYEPSLALEDNNSLYTKFLVEGLRGVQPTVFDENGRIIRWSGSVEENGDITPNSLHSYVYHKVAELTEQVPQLKTMESSGFAILSHPHLAFTGVSAIETMIDAANRYISNKEHHDALIFIDKVLRIEPKHTRALAQKADVLAKIKHYSDCLGIIDILLSIDPKNRYILGLKKQVIEKKEYALTEEGRSLAKSGCLEKAIECFDRAIAIDPKYYEAWAGKAFTLASRSRYSESSHCFDEALAIERENKQLWIGKGFALHRMFEDKAAFECFDRAIAIDSDYPEGWIGRGASLHHLAEYAKAIECFDRAIAIDQSIMKHGLQKHSV